MKVVATSPDLAVSTQSYFGLDCVVLSKPW